MKKAFNFRSAIVCVLVLIMCLTAFVACDKNKGDQGKTDSLEGLNKARDYVKQLYINNNEETAADYTVVSKVNIGGVTYPVTWAVTIKTEGASVDDVKVVAGESNVTIDVIDMADSDIEYTLTATVTDANGNTATVDFKRKVPKFHVATWAEYAEAADGKLLVVDGIVTMFNSKKDGASYNNMYIQDNDGAYYAYSMDEDPKDKNIAVGMKVRLTGTKKNYNGTYELEKVLIKEVLSTEIVTIEPADVTELLKNAESVKAKALTDLQGRMVTVKGAIAVEVDTDQKYCYFTVGGVKTYIRPSASAGFLNSTEISKFVKDFTDNKGHVIDVTGQAVIYNGAFYMQPTKADAVVYGAVADLTPAEQVKFVKENANALKDVTYSGYSVTLPSASEVFTDVKIAWTVDNTDVCKIEDGKATFTYDYATAGRTVKLTATYTHATDTTVAPLQNEYTLELLIPQDATVEEFLAKDEDDKVYIITGYIVADGSSSGKGSFVVADATGAVFSYNKADVAVGDKVKVYGTRASNAGVPQIGTLNVVKVDAEGETYTYPEPAVIDGTTLDLSTLTKTSIVDYTGKYTKITGLTYYKDGSYNSAGLLKEGKTAGSTAKDDYTQVLSLYSASDAIPEDWAGKPVVVYGYVRGFSTNKYLTIQVAKVEIGYDDATKVAQAKEALTETKIGGTEFTESFTLPATGLYDTTITWAVKGESSVLAIEGNHATVTKPETERETVTIVATIKSGEVTDTKEFTITILGEVPSYAVNWTDANLTAVYGDDNTALAAGGEVKKGTVVKFTVVLPANKLVSSVTVNGEALENTAYVTTFSVTVSAVSNVVVNYVEYTPVTVAEFIAKTKGATLYAITGYIGASSATATEEGSFVVIDATGAAFSYNKVVGLALGDHVTVYGTRAENFSFPQVGTVHVEKLEGGTYVEPTAEEIAVADVKVDGTELYVSKFYQIVGGTIAVDGNYINLMNGTTRVASLYTNTTDAETYKALAGKEVVVYGYSRGVNTKNSYWQVQVARMVEVTDALKVERAANALTLASTTLGAGEITLPATGINGTTITWASDNAAIAIAADGVTATIVAGTADTPVKLTATITLNGESTTKEFNVTVTATTPEYAVTFANVTGATVDVQVDGVAIATGAKVEQGKTLTISVTVDTENYVLVAVKAGATTLEAVEGKYTHQVVADVEITVEVKSNKGTTAEKAYSVAEIIEATSSLATDEVTSDILYLKGVVKSFDNMTTYAKNLYLADENDSTKTFLVYSASFGTAEGSVTSISVGDTVVVAGYVKNYKGTIEMATANSVNVQFISRTAGQGSIVIGETGNATVTVDNGQTTGDNGTTFTFEVAVTTGYEIVSVKVNGKTVEAAEGKYTGTISGVTTITVETKAEGAADPVVVATATFGTATNSGKVSGYTTSWSATCDGVKFNIANFNNNNNGWSYIRCGRRGTASVASISTDAAMTNAITKVVVTIDSVTVDSVNSIQLVVASDASFNNIVETVDGTVAQGEMTFNVAEANRAANLYYKVEFNCKTGSGNGFVQVSKVEFYGLA